MTKPLSGAGGQGIIFGCGPGLDGAVVKLYKTPRSSAELERVQALIQVSRGLSPTQPAAREWFERLNLPMRPVLDPAGRFGGVVLPPLPAQLNAKAYRYDPSSSRIIPGPTTVQFEAQFLSRKNSPVGVATDLWQWRLLTSLAETVALMHTVNLVHGDLSLSNVLALQKDETHLRDEIYLIDLDDAFLDDGHAELSSAVRKSRSTYDPYSLRAGQLSKATDVFVVALWAVAFMQYRFDPPEEIAKRIPEAALQRMAKADLLLPAVVSAALGPIRSRPTMLELYKAVRKAALKAARGK